MHNFDSLMRAYQRQVQLPWRDDVPSAARVWMLWYDKSLELPLFRFLNRLGNRLVQVGEVFGWLPASLAGNLRE